MKNVYTREQRIAYAEGLPRDLEPKKIHNAGQEIPFGLGLAQHKPDQKTKNRKDIIVRLRNQLVPNDCVLNVTDRRISDIEQELRKLKVESFPNAVSVLFRVFLELSADSYIERIGLSTSDEARLGTKLLDVTNHLVSHKKLTEKQAKPVQRAAQSDSYLAPSVTVMHQYVHNQHMFPSPRELRIHWNNLQPWFIAVWST